MRGRLGGKEVKEGKENPSTGKGRAPGDARRRRAAASRARGLGITLLCEPRREGQVGARPGFHS